MKLRHYGQNEIKARRFAQSSRMHPSGSLLTVIFLFQAYGALTSNRSLIIKLNHGGSLKGIELKTETGRSIRSFLGIPYAKAPVGELRFKVKLLKQLFTY